MERPTLPLPRKDILVVEDDQEFRQTLSRSLEIEGYFVQQAPDGQAALELLLNLSQSKKARPDLIISDINMPRLNGLDFYRAVRRDLRLVSIPFIFVTAYDSPDDIRAGRMLGVEDYLTKPIHHHELVKVVNARLLRAAEVEIAHMHQSYLETVKVLANSIESRDPYTSEHVERVASYARKAAEALKWSGETIRMLEFGARLHDIGKIIIPDDILKKPGELTQEEWAWMKLHPLEGAKMVYEISHLRGAIPYILYHHERWDGNGYPKGIAGREIPIEGRLMAIVDVYDALTNVRPYHPARPHQEVLHYLQTNRGAYFDPDLIDVFVDVLDQMFKGQQGY